MLPAQALGSLLPTGETELSVELLASSAPGAAGIWEGNQWLGVLIPSLSPSFPAFPTKRAGREGGRGWILVQRSWKFLHSFFFICTFRDLLSIALLCMDFDFFCTKINLPFNSILYQLFEVPHI